MRNHNPNRNSSVTVLPCWRCFHNTSIHSITYRLVVWTDATLTSSKISVWTESKDSCDPRRAAFSRALRPLYTIKKKNKSAHWIFKSHLILKHYKGTYFISKLDSLGRREFLKRFISSGCLLLLLRIAQSSSVSAASYLPWRRYKAPRFFNWVLIID